MAVVLTSDDQFIALTRNGEIFENQAGNVSPKDVDIVGTLIVF